MSPDFMGATPAKCHLWLGYTHVVRSNYYNSRSVHSGAAPTETSESFRRRPAVYSTTPQKPYQNTLDTLFRRNVYESLARVGVVVRSS